MIISASYKTDIPCYFTDWFLYEIKRYTNVEFIVFWTKWNRFSMEQLKSIGIPFYFNFTFTDYGDFIEPFKSKVTATELINQFRLISDTFGKDRIVWRYDPILISEGHWSIDDHVRSFTKLSKLLGDYTDTCVLSFVDMYNKVKNRGFRAPTSDEIIKLCGEISEVNKNLKLRTCAENIDLIKYGITKNACIDAERIQSILGRSIEWTKSYKRKFCGCIDSKDIGSYHTCSNGCIYCYAN